MHMTLSTLIVSFGKSKNTPQNLQIFGQHGANMFSAFPFESEQPLANKLRHHLQLNSPYPGSSSAGSAQTQPFSTVLSNTFPIFGYHDDASMYSALPSDFEQLNNPRQQLQLTSPNLDRPSSTISQSSSGYFLASTNNQCSQSTIHPYGPSAVSTDLTDNTVVIGSHNSFKNIGNLSNNQHHHGEDMGLYPAGKKFRGNENF